MCDPYTAFGFSSWSRGQEPYFPLLYFPPGHLFLCRVWPWGRAVCACLVSLQRSDGQTVCKGFLASTEYASLFCPGKRAGSAGVCLSDESLAGTATGWGYAMAIMPMSVPLLVDQECSSRSPWGINEVITLNYGRTGNMFDPSSPLLSWGVILTCWCMLSLGRNTELGGAIGWGIHMTE